MFGPPARLPQQPQPWGDVLLKQSINQLINQTETLPLFTPPARPLQEPKPSWDNLYLDSVCLFQQRHATPAYPQRAVRPCTL